MENLISLKKASQISGYSPDYLGYLIRKKKLGGKRVGRDWFTTEKALTAYLSSKKFVPVNNFLSVNFKPKFKYIFIFLLVLIMSGAIILALNPSVVIHTLPGDKTKEKLGSKQIIIEDENEEQKELEITTYRSDETGELEISVEEKP